MRVLFLSNGHGEDLIGSRLALKLKAVAPGLAVRAFPLVGDGSTYRAAGIGVAGPARQLPSGGLTMHSPSNLLADLRAGLLSNLAAQLRQLRQEQPAALVVVGDIWALTLSLLVRVPAGRRYVVQTLVSALLDNGQLVSPSRLFMERITIPERWLLKRFSAGVWLRDSETAAELRARSVNQARYAGSFLFSELPRRTPQPGKPLVLLLPGSRSWADQSLALQLPLALSVPQADFAVSWAGSGRPVLPPGWSERADGGALLNGNVSVEFRSGAFSELLARAAVVVGTAGTAMEQAAASGIPCLSFVIPGRHTAAFLRNQERLLRGALHVAASADAAALSHWLVRLLSEKELQQQALVAGSRVLGEPGGLVHIAETLASELSGD